MRVLALLLLGLLFSPVRSGWVEWIVCDTLAGVHSVFPCLLNDDLHKDLVVAAFDLNRISWWESDGKMGVEAPEPSIFPSGGLRVSPNPCCDATRVELPGQPSGSGSLTLYGTDGRLVGAGIRKNSEGHRELDTSVLPGGFNLLCFRSGSLLMTAGLTVLE